MAVWSARQANVQADKATLLALAENDRTLAILAADRTRLVEANVAQKVYQDAHTNAYHSAETAWAGHSRTFYLAEINARAQLSSGLNDPWSVRDDALRVARAPSDRNRLQASHKRTTDAITIQRNAELAFTASETQRRLDQVASRAQQAAVFVASAQTLVESVTNAFRLSGAVGTQPLLAAAAAHLLPGTLGVAAQISLALSAENWSHIASQVGDRMNRWQNDADDALVEYDLPVDSRPTALTRFPAPLDVGAALRESADGSARPPSRHSVASVENPLSADEVNGPAEALSNGVSSGLDKQSGSGRGDAPHVSSIAEAQAGEDRVVVEWESVASRPKGAFNAKIVNDMIADGLVHQVEGNKSLVVLFDVVGDQIVAYYLKRLDPSPPNAKVGYMPGQRTETIYVLHSIKHRPLAEHEMNIETIEGILREHRTGRIGDLHASLFKTLVRAEDTHIKAAMATFTLHLVPLMGAIDYGTEGKWGEMSLSLAGDAAWLLGGPIAGAIGASSRLASGGVIANRMRITAATIEGGVAIYQAKEGVYAISRGDNLDAAGFFGDAVLRLVGAKTHFANAANATKAVIDAPRKLLTGTYRGRTINVEINKINIRNGKATEVGSGIEYAWRNHGSLFGGSLFGGGPGQLAKSKFSISKDRLKEILQRRDVATSPVRQSGTTGNYIREVDVGEIVGHLPLNKGGDLTSVMTIITDIKGNIVNVFPGRLGRGATLP